RKLNPNAAILIISPPDEFDIRKRTGGEECSGKRPLLLSKIEKTQKQIAKEEKTLFWDTQGAMGGNCSMSQWQVEGLARNDGVHFTKEGYYKLAELFYSDFIDWIMN